MKRGLLVLSLLGLAACDGVFSRPHNNVVPDAPPIDAPIDGQIVFTTSQAYRGGLLGGVEGADAICADHAADAGLPGTFKAWISQVDNSAADRLTHSTKPYILVTGSVVADSWDDLLRFDLQHAIDRDENGDTPTTGIHGAPVWTATRIDGTANPWTPGGTPTQNPRLDCTGWDSITGGVGLLGQWNKTDVFWTATSSGISCSETAHLYCFQQ